MKKRFRMVVGLLLVLFATATFFGCATVKKKAEYNKLVNVLDTAEKYIAHNEFEKARKLFDRLDLTSPTISIDKPENTGKPEIKIQFYYNKSRYFDNYEKDSKGFEDATKNLDSLFDRAGLILKKSIEGNLRVTIYELKLELKRHFPRFYSFLQDKGMFENIPVLGFFKFKPEYNDASDLFEEIGNFNALSLVDGVKAQMSDFDFHDAMEVLERDCYENLSKTDADKLFYWDCDCNVTPNYDTRLYDFEYYDYFPLDIGFTGLYRFYYGLKNEIMEAGVKFNFDLCKPSFPYSEIHNAEDYIWTAQVVDKRGPEFGITPECDLDKGEDGYYRLKYTGFPNANKDDYEVKITEFRPKYRSSANTAASSSSNSGDSSDSGLESLFGSVMCEVCGEHLALYEAFDPVRNKRVDFCRSCLEKRQQDDNAKLQKALEQLRIL